MPDEKDKNLSQDETQNVDEQEVEQSTTEETEQETEVEEEASTSQEESSEGEDEVEKPKSHRENLRIQELVKKLREQREPEPAPKSQNLDYRTALEADDETIQKLEADRKAASSYSFNEGIKRAEAIQFRTLLEIDAPRISSKYPQFDQDSPDFNPTLAATLNDWYLGTVGFDQKTGFVNNSNIRYKDFVEGVMEIAEVMAEKKSSQTAANLAKQAANTALRPGGNTAKKFNLNQAPGQMSDEELEAVIGSVIPTKKR